MACMCSTQSPVNRITPGCSSLSKNLHVWNAAMRFGQEHILAGFATTSLLKLLPNRRTRPRILVHNHPPGHDRSPLIVSISLSGTLATLTQFPQVKKRVFQEVDKPRPE